MDGLNAHPAWLAIATNAGKGGTLPPDSPEDGLAMKVSVVKSKCLRSGQCTYLHPKIFQEGEGGYPEVLLESIPDELKEEAEDAADICPSGAILIDE